MITIVDYGMGNLGSLENMIKKVGGQAEFSNDPQIVATAKKLILPGVGHFDQAMDRLAGLNLIEALNISVKIKKVPILCICLGAQLATQSSEEGSRLGFGWIKGNTLRFNLPVEYKIPHMGWNDVTIKRDSYIFKNIPEDPCFYFVHSYYLKLDETEDVLTSTSYGIEFTSSYQHDNIIGMQFHPEKSHKYGMCVLRNFVELGQC